MHYVNYQQVIRRLLLSLLMLGLAACSVGPAPHPAPNTPAAAEFAYVATADIAADARRAEVEAIYGGSIIVFKPEAGFAILGFSEAEAALTTLTTDANRDVLSSPEVSAAGVDAWAGGVDAWAGGFDAWAGGFDAWAGGAGGPTTFGGNLPLWDKIRLADAQAAATNLGSSVTVAVLDTGVDTDHPALSGRLTAANTWKDYVDNDNNPAEVAGGAAYGHGTAVAGVVVQVAPQARILPLRVLGPDGSGSVADVVSAVDWAVAMGADVINLSLGSASYVASLQVMLEYAASNNVYLVASAGNSGDEHVTYPAATMSNNGSYGNNAVGVGSVGALDLKSPFSSYGAVDMVAPGESVHTLYPDGRRAAATGTSFATPMVAGSLALSLAESLQRRVAPAKSVATSADPVQTLNPLYPLGNGRLNVSAYLASVMR